MTKCIIGDCWRPVAGVIEGQGRCREHCASLAIALRAEREEDRRLRAAQPDKPRRSRRNVVDVLKSKARRLKMTKDELVNSPLLIRVMRAMTLGCDRRTGADERAAPGDIIDAIDLESRGILAGFDSAEAFAASVCFGNVRNPKGELVNPDDKPRVLKRGAISIGGRRGA